MALPPTCFALVLLSLLVALLPFLVALLASGLLFRFPGCALNGFLSGLFLHSRFLGGSLLRRGLLCRNFLRHRFLGCRFHRLLGRRCLLRRSRSGNRLCRGLLRRNGLLHRRRLFDRSRGLLTRGFLRRRGRLQTRRFVACLLFGYPARFRSAWGRCIAARLIRLGCNALGPRGEFFLFL